MLGLGLGLNRSNQLQGFESLVKSAGGVFYYDARKDLVQANGATPDRSGKGNDVTWANFAGTGASGLVIEDGKVFRRLDGTDDFGSMVNTASIDITSAPLAVFATVRIAVGAGSGYIFSKFATAWDSSQYCMYWDNTNKKIAPLLENVARGSSASNTVLEGNWYDVGFIWDGVNVRIYINGIQSGSITALSGALTSRPNVRIGVININYLKGDLGTLSVHAGTNAIESRILKARNPISRAYI
jgi:hypothetical protein